jgi:hypothetical protein
LGGKLAMAYHCNIAAHGAVVQRQTQPARRGTTKEKRMHIETQLQGFSRGRVALLLGLSITTGCGSNPSGGTPDAATVLSPADSAAGGAGGSPTDVASAATCSGAPDFTAASACNSVVNNAQSVDFSPGTGSPPTFSGGTVVDGLYVATKAEAWGTTTGTGRRFTLVVEGNGSTIFWAGDVLSGTTTSSFRANTTASVSGNQLLQTTTCRTGEVTIPPALSYTATPTEMVFATTSGSIVTATTYTRQGCP